MQTMLMRRTGARLSAGASWRKPRPVALTKTWSPWCSPVLDPLPIIETVPCLACMPLTLYLHVFRAQPTDWWVHSVLQPEIRLDLDAQAGPARIWVQQEPIQREIAYIFRKFLRDFADETTGELLYKQRMRDMCTSARPPSPHIPYHIDRSMNGPLAHSSMSSAHLILGLVRPGMGINHKQSRFATSMQLVNFCQQR